LFGRTYLLDIDFTRDENGQRSSKYTVDAYHAGNVRLASSFNCAVLTAVKLTPVHSFPGMCLFFGFFAGFTLKPHSQNHSCEPNLNINPVYLNDGDTDKPLLVLFTDREIAPWEELCFSYCAVDEDSDRGGVIARDLPIHSKCYCGAPKCRGVMFA
jgi:histone-lysine N-methyltransferase SUV39H